MTLIVSKFALPFQNFDNIIYINREFFKDPPLPLKQNRSNFDGGEGGVLSGGKFDVGLNSTKHEYVIGAMHPVFPLTDTGYPATTSVRDGSGFGVFQDAGESITLSAVAIGFDIDDNDNGSANEDFAHATRKVYLSSGPRSNVGTHRQQQTSLLTHISASFNLGVIYEDGSMNTYHVPALTATSHDRGGATANPLSAVQIRAFDVGSDPETRRLVSLGYR